MSQTRPSAHQIVDALLESCADSRRKESNRRGILRKLEAVSKRKNLSTHAAQMHTSAFGPVPSYAMEDPSCDWWASSDAETLLQELTDMLAPNSTYGVKPSTPPRPGRPSSAEWPPLSRTPVDPKWTLDD